MARFPLAFALLVAACASDEYDPLCPDGWDGELTGQCQPPDRLYDDFPGTSGVFGYVKHRACTAHCDDIVEELPSQRVVVFADTLPSECAAGEFGWESDPSADPLCREHVVAETQTDDEGVFTIELPPGDYLVVTDTVVFESWEGKRVSLFEGFPQFVSLYFDAVPI